MKRSIILLISAILVFLGTIFTTYRYMMQSSRHESDRINQILINEVGRRLNFSLKMQSNAAHSFLTGFFSYKFEGNDTVIYIKDKDLVSFHKDVYEVLEEFVSVNTRICAAMFIIDPTVYPEEGGKCFAPIIEQDIPGRRNIASNLDLHKSISYNYLIKTGYCTWRLPNPKSPIYGKAIIYYVPIYREDGAPFGLFAINVSYDMLHEILDASLPYSNEGSSITLLDDQRNVILSTRDDLQTIDSLDDKENFIYQSKIDGTPFTILTTCTRQAVYLEANRTQRTILLVSGIGMLLMLVCCIVISRQIRRKVLRIAAVEGELQMAASVQKSILKPESLHTGHVRLNAMMRPAREAGGDLYDYVQCDGKVVFCIGDVSGKGMPAALFMTQVVSLFRSIVSKSHRPAYIASHINDVLAHDNPQMTFCTFFVGVFDHESHELTFCNAGHNRPVLITDGQARYLDVRPNLALGLMPGFRYHEESMTLSVGARLLQYTDGVNEARNADGKFYGDDRLLRICAQMQSGDTLEAIIHNVDRFAAGYPQSDDITLLVIEPTD